MAAKIPPIHLSYSYTFNRNILNSFMINEINENEVIDSINCLKTKSTHGLHGISSKSIKLSKTVISTILTKLYNKCIENETFPQILKQSQIIPIPKINPPTSATDFRPISLLPTISKVFEKILHKKMLNFLTKQKIINTCQYGFLNKHFTELALTSTHDQLIKILTITSILAQYSWI